MVQGVIQLAFAIIHFVHVAGIPAEQVVLQMKPVLHHLEADQRRGFGHVDRILRRSLGLMLAMHPVQVDRQQHQDRCQNHSETQVQLLSYIHNSNLPHPALWIARCLPYWVGSRRNSIISVDSSGRDSKCHFLAASRAAPARTGCPPTSAASLTVPLAATVTRTFTTPVMFIRLASSG